MVGFEIRDQNEKRDREAVSSLRFNKTPVNSLSLSIAMSFSFFIWKNGLSFGHGINEHCRCVEFVGVMIIRLRIGL